MKHRNLKINRKNIDVQLNASSTLEACPQAKRRNGNLNLHISLLALFTMCALMFFSLLPWETVESAPYYKPGWLLQDEQLMLMQQEEGIFSVAGTSDDSSTTAEPELPKIYFGDNRLLWKAGLFGDFQTTFLTTPPKLGYVTVDAANQKIYYMERYGKFLWSIDLDGRNVKQVLSGKFGRRTRQNFVDTLEGKLYWRSSLRPTRISRINLDGTGEETVIETGRRIAQIYFDAVSRRLYWFEDEKSDEGNLLGYITIIRSANLDGSDIRDHVTGIKADFINGFGVDNVNKHLYWLDYRMLGDDLIDYSTIWRANFEDPGGVVDVGAGGGEMVIDLGETIAEGFVVDETNRMFYWFDYAYSFEMDEYVFFVYRANFADESPTPERVSETPSDWIDYTTLSHEGKIYWTDSDEIPTGDHISSLWSINVDGTEEPQNLTYLDFPSGIIVDTSNEKLYWTVPTLGTIRQANLDGTDTVDLITGLNQPEDVMIDPVEGKIYWTEGPRPDDESGEEIDAWSIRRANLDGTNLEMFYYDEFSLTPLTIRGLAIDIKSRMVYWTSDSWEGIQAMKTDKSDYFPRSVVDYLYSTDYPFDIDIDAVNRQLYWTESKSGTIKRANLDGTRVRAIVSELINPRGITVDPVNKKIYWTADEKGGKVGKVQWANFDGTSVDDIIEKTYPSLKYIALGIVGAPPSTVYPTGDVNGDFQVNAYDAALILQFSVGLIDKFPVDELLSLSPENVTPRHYEVSVPVRKAFGGERIIVPVQVNDATGFIAGGVRLIYDPAVLKANQVHMSINGTWKANAELNGEVRVAFVSFDDVAKNSILANRMQEHSSTLFVVEFDVLNDAEGKESPLILDYVELSNSMSIQKNHGLLTVLPGESRLFQNYPNPFNPETWIPYQLSADADVTISIYDVHGAIVRQLTPGLQSAGSYLARDKAAYWDGQNNAGELASSGVYFYVLKATNRFVTFDFVATRKMVILK